MWRWRPPSDLDFDCKSDCFECMNYQYVLFGMGFRPQADGFHYGYPLRSEAQKEFANLRANRSRAKSAFPDHRALLNDIYRSGFQPKPANLPAWTAVWRQRSQAVWRQGSQAVWRQRRKAL